MRAKKCLIAGLLFVMIMMLLLITALCSYHTMSEGAKVRQIEIDSFSLKYFVTEENELYVGGSHSDWKGIYDTGFYWGFLYRVRRLFSGGSDAPVRFAKNVQEVFTGSDGFLFTDLDSTLFYFGEKNKGKLTPIAANVKSASAGGNCIVYVTTDGEAYCREFENGRWNTAIPIANNATQIYTNGFLARVIAESGEFYQINLSSGADGSFDKNTTSREKYDGEAQAMVNSSDRTALLSASGELLCYRWETGQKGGTLWVDGIEKSKQEIDNHVLAVAVNSTIDSYYLRADGGIYRFTEPSNKENELIAVVERIDVIDVAIDYKSIYLLFSDGSYDVMRTVRQSGQSANQGMVP